MKQIKRNKKKAGRPILVTGGAGFIGSHVVDELIEAGNKVVVLDDLSGGFRSNVNPKATFIKGSITNATLVNKLFKKYKFEYVFHLAAYAAEGLSHFIKIFNAENNILGSLNLINASINHGVKCFVFTSSIAVYGRGQVPMREDMHPEPEDSYGIAKYAVELELQSVKNMFGMDYVIFRPHNVYGERQNIGDKYRNVVGIFMNRILKGEPLPIFGDGLQQRAFTHIEDVAPVIAGSIHNKKAYNHTFNIGADTPYSVKHLAGKVIQVMGESDDYQRIFYPPRNEAVIAYSDHSKVRDLLGHNPKVSLDHGLKRMSDWVKSHGARSSKRFKNIEVRKNLPSAWLS